MSRAFLDTNICLSCVCPAWNFDIIIRKSLLGLNSEKVILNVFKNFCIIIDHPAFRTDLYRSVRNQKVISLIGIKVINFFVFK